MAYTAWHFPPGSRHMDLSGRTQTWTFPLAMGIVGDHRISHAAHHILVRRDSITTQARWTHKENMIVLMEDV